MQGYATFADVYGSANGATYDQAALVGESNADVTSGQAVAGAGSSGAGIQPINLLPGLRGISPFAGALVIVGVLVAVKFLREWKAPEGELKEVKVGLHNVVVVTLMAVAGIPLVKGLLAKYHVPGVSEWVLNA